MSTSFKATNGGDGILETDTLIVDGTTISPTEIAYLDGVTAGTVSASKAVVVDADKHIDTIVIADGGLKLGATTGTAVTSTAAELNFLDGSVAGTAVASKATVLGANKNLDTIVIADGGLFLGAGAGTAVTSTATELNQYSVEIGMADAGTAQSRWVTAPHVGNIVAAYVVNSVANTTTKTVFTLKIATVLVTMPALEVAITQAAGTVSSSVPTATNTVTAGQAIEVISDGGTDAVMPVTVTLVISR